MMALFVTHQEGPTICTWSLPLHLFGIQVNLNTNRYNDGWFGLCYHQEDKETASVSQQSCSQYS